MKPRSLKDFNRAKQRFYGMCDTKKPPSWDNLDKLVDYILKPERSMTVCR